MKSLKFTKLFSAEPGEQLRYLDNEVKEVESWANTGTVFSVLVYFSKNIRPELLDNPRYYQRIDLPRLSQLDEAVNNYLYQNNNSYTDKWEKQLAEQYPGLEGREYGQKLDELIELEKRRRRPRQLVDLLYQEAYYKLLESNPALDDLPTEELNQSLRQKLREPAFRKELVQELTAPRIETKYLREYGQQLPPFLAQILKHQRHGWLHLIGRRTATGIEVMEHQDLGQQHYGENVYWFYRNLLAALFRRQQEVYSTVLFLGANEEFTLYEAPGLVFPEWTPRYSHLIKSNNKEGLVGVKIIQQVEEVAYDYFILTKQQWPVE